MARRHQTVSPLDAHLGFWLRFVSNQVSAGFSAELAARGVSVTEWVALRSLYDGIDASHGSLVDALGMTKGAVSKIVARLRERGLVAHAGARAQGLALTPAGRALVPKLAACADANDARFFGHLDDARREALLALLKEMVQVHQMKDVPLA